MSTLLPTTLLPLSSFTNPENTDVVLTESKEWYILNSAVISLREQNKMIAISSVGYTLGDFERLICELYDVDAIAPGSFIGDNAEKVNMSFNVFEYFKACLTNSALHFDNRVKIESSRANATQIEKALCASKEQLPLMLQEKGIILYIVKWRLNINR